MQNVMTLSAWLFVAANVLWISDLLMIFGIYLVTRPFPTRKNSSFLLSTLTIILWHAAAINVTKSDIFVQFPIPILIIGSIIVSYLLSARITPFSNIIDSVPQYWLVLIQFFRIFGGVFLGLYMQGYLLRGLHYHPVLETCSLV